MRSARWGAALALGALLGAALVGAPSVRTNAQEAPKGAAALAGKKAAFAYAGDGGGAEVVGQVESVDATGFWIHYEAGVREKRSVTAFLPWTSVRFVRLEK